MCARGTQAAEVDLEQRTKGSVLDTEKPESLANLFYSNRDRRPTDGEFIETNARLWLLRRVWILRRKERRVDESRRFEEVRLQDGAPAIGTSSGQLGSLLLSC